MLHVGELVQPGSLEQGARNPTESVRGTPGLIDGHVRTSYTGLLDLASHSQCIGFACIANNLTQHQCSLVLFWLIITNNYNNKGMKLCIKYAGQNVALSLGRE